MPRTLGRITTRAYQDEGFDAIVGALGRGVRRVLVQMPTGTGKTILMAMVADWYWRTHGRRVWVLAHMRRLLKQAAEKFDMAGLDCARDYGDYRLEAEGELLARAPVVLSTRQSAASRVKWDSRGREDVGLVLIDEAHRAESEQYRAFLRAHPKALVVGFTATADRGDGVGLGRIFEEVPWEYSLKRAIDEGALVEPEFHRYDTGISLGSLARRGGDFADSDLAEAIQPHVNYLCNIIVREAGPWRRVIAFWPSVAVAEAAASCCEKLGPGYGLDFPSMAVSGRDDEGEQNRILGAFAEKRLRSLHCCALLTEGYDEPSIGMVVLARPTLSRALFAQMVGRGLRLYPPNKTKCPVIDFTFNTATHQLVKPAELFDVSGLDDEVVDEANAIIERGEERRPKAAIERAEKIVLERRRLTIMAKKLEHIDARKTVSRPLAIDELGLVSRRKTDFVGLAADEPASERQVAFLRKMKVEVPEGLSRSGANRYIDEVVRRRKLKLASAKQVELVVRYCGLGLKAARELKAKDASDLLDRHFGKKKGGKPRKTA